MLLIEATSVVTGRKPAIERRLTFSARGDFRRSGLRYSRLLRLSLGLESLLKLLSWYASSRPLRPCHRMSAFAVNHLELLFRWLASKPE